MNFLFLSPHFPPHYLHFVTALREAGIRVLGVGDTHVDTLLWELREKLAEYYAVPRLDDLDAMVRAVGYFTWRYGKMDRIDSLNEAWLQVDAELRRLFCVEGMGPDEMRRKRSKWGLHQIFEAAKIPTIPTERATNATTVKAFAQQYGYPVVLKPAVGVGSVDAFKVSSDAEVDQKFVPARPEFIVQAFQKGQIVTWDGVVDREGKIIFSMSHEYSDGVMETIAEKRDMYFWSYRQIPPSLDALGRKVVAALELKERWFHLEFFRRAKDDYVVLEANLRPPGGFMTDMMNYACDTDVYRLYASVVAGKGGGEWVRPPSFHICHVARFKAHRYKRTREELVKALGDKLIWARDLPPLFAAAMGDEMFLTKHQTDEEMFRDVRMIQERA